ncbi:hypothetical protein M9H77_22707 [Catharanthus roseus]|uniref:Uncharacterized protein n=1 Tax=Catharanthus roseus TaxID=4058 RepID=A0ACC0AR83_CATRO|nr:hypothetical protein M9H77_22707 [Catharanthus roseus]
MVKSPIWLDGHENNVYTLKLNETSCSCGKCCLSFHDSLWNQLLTIDAKLEQSCFDLKCWHDDIISLVVDLFSSWTPMWNMIPNFLDSFDGKLLVNKVEEYLCSLIEDFLDKSIRRVVEPYSYMIPSFETFVIALQGISFRKPFLECEGSS